MADVFRHNRWDILSLAALWARIGLTFGNPSDHIQHGLDWLGAARIFEEAGRFDEAVRSYREALDRALSEAERIEGLDGMGLVLKQNRRWRDAIEIWEEAIRIGPWRIGPYEEIAKAYEHRLGDYTRAMDVVRRALARIEIAGELKPSYQLQTEYAVLEHRLKRLKRKLGDG